MAKAERKEQPQSEYTYEPEVTGEKEPHLPFEEQATNNVPDGNDINNVAGQAVAEEMPDIDEYAAEPSEGAWPAGWYKAEIIEGYATQSGKQMETADALSKNGDSRNVNICFRVTNGEKTRNYRGGFNYREDDFNPDVLEAIKEARTEFSDTRGKWPGEAADIQRSSLAVAKIGQFQKAVGFKFARHDGRLDPTVFVGQQVDLRMKVNEDGFNDITEYAKLGERTSGSRRRNRK